MNIRYPLLIDGGLSNALEAEGCSLDHRLWSARCLGQDTEAVIAAHTAYLEAGAGCITTASYQATIPGFMEEGYTRDQAEALILRSVQLAQEAVTRFMTGRTGKPRPLVAASIGPYGAYLADGSEYRGNYGLSETQLMDFHSPRLKILDGSSADLLACETIPDFTEARALDRLLEGVRKQAWITFSCRDEGHINDGTVIGKCLDLFRGHPQVFAIGVNCTAPQYISALVKKIRKGCGSKKVIVYPNSGQLYDAASRTWLGTGDPKSFAGMAMEWLDLGADIIGGCCRIGAGEIRLIRELLDIR